MPDIHPAERFFSADHPVARVLDMTFEGVANHVLTVSLSAPPAFAADPEANTCHSGLASLVLDTVMGGTVMGEMAVIQPIATAGLTAQHLRRPRVSERLLCEARYEGEHEDIAHVSGRLIAAETGEILSTATGAFMIGTRSKPLGARL